jgi:hypothetical protein
MLPDFVTEHLVYCRKLLTGRVGTLNQRECERVTRIGGILCKRLISFDGDTRVRVSTLAYCNKFQTGPISR